MLSMNVNGIEVQAETWPKLRRAVAAEEQRQARAEKDREKLIDRAYDCAFANYGRIAGQLGEHHKPDLYDLRDHVQQRDQYDRPLFVVKSKHGDGLLCLYRTQRIIGAIETPAGMIEAVLVEEEGDATWFAVGAVNDEPTLHTGVAVTVSIRGPVAVQLYDYWLAGHGKQAA